jgi:Phosphotransferase enzyme family
MSEPFGFLGMDFDDIHRRRGDIILEDSKVNRITWDSALLAASSFSGGRACSSGKGSKGESKSFPAEPRREGSFNICYWVAVEGTDTQWIVRFPKPIASHSVIRTKLRSEVATLQFLRQNTQVPVPKVVGYGLGDENLPPFLIMENVDGMRLSLLWMIDLPQSAIDKILRSLAKIQHELLSHRFDTIGMLDLSPGDEVGPTFINPLSLDVFEHCRDGVSPTLPPPFKRVTQYYTYKLEAWNHRLRQQRNSIDSYSDGQRKFINSEIIQEFLSHSGGPVQDEGPFFLVHPDLHGKNILIEPGKWTVKAIIDWEGTCVLPLESARSPPKCLHNILPGNFLPTSDAYRRFQDRLELYARQFALLSSNNAEQRSSHVSCSITPILFFTWAIDDVRDLDQLVWQHIAPSMYPELQRGYDSILHLTAECQGKTSVRASMECLVNDFVDGLYRSGRYDTGTMEYWVEKKLKDLEVYQHEFEVIKRNDEQGSTFLSS